MSQPAIGLTQHLCDHNHNHSNDPFDDPTTSPQVLPHEIAKLSSCQLIWLLLDDQKALEHAYQKEPVLKYIIDQISGGSSLKGGRWSVIRCWNLIPEFDWWLFGCGSQVPRYEHSQLSLIFRCFIGRKMDFENNSLTSDWKVLRCKESNIVLFNKLSKRIQVMMSKFPAIPAVQSDMQPHNYLQPLLTRKDLRALEGWSPCRYLSPHSMTCITQVWGLIPSVATVIVEEASCLLFSHWWSCFYYGVLPLVLMFSKANSSISCTSWFTLSVALFPGCGRESDIMRNEAHHVWKTILAWQW